MCTYGSRLHQCLLQWGGGGAAAEAEEGWRGAKMIGAYHWLLLREGGGGGGGGGQRREGRVKKRWIWCAQEGGKKRRVCVAAVLLQLMNTFDLSTHRVTACTLYTPSVYITQGMSVFQRKKTHKKSKICLIMLFCFCPMHTHNHIKEPNHMHCGSTAWGGWGTE